MIAAALARLERAMINGSNRALRTLVLDGEPDHSVWPADLPPLAPDVHAWLAWRAEGETWTFLDVPEHGLLRRHSLALAVEPSRELAGSIAIFDGLACDPGGRIQRLDWDDDDKRIVVPLAYDIAELVDRIAAAYEARRSSPWRAMRIAPDDDASWVKPRDLDLTAAPEGTAIAWSEQLKRRRQGWLAVAIGDRWATTFASWHGDFDVPDSVDGMRHEFAGGAVETFDAAGLVAKIKATRAENSRGFRMLRGNVRVWQQPNMDELLERFASTDLPLRFSPGTRDFTGFDVELPADLRALYAFANGSETAIFQRFRLEPLAGVLSTMRGFAEYDIPHWHPSFVPFLDGGNGDCWYVDVAGIHGPPGCVIDFDHERPDEREVRYDNIHEWLECLVEGIEAGIYEWEDEAVFPIDRHAAHVHDGTFTNHAYPWTRRFR